MRILYLLKFMEARFDSCFTSSDEPIQALIAKISWGLGFRVLVGFEGHDPHSPEIGAQSKSWNPEGHSHQVVPDLGVLCWCAVHLSSCLLNQTAVNDKQMIASKKLLEASSHGLKLYGSDLHRKPHLEKRVQGYMIPAIW